jgi:porin
MYLLAAIPTLIGWSTVARAQDTTHAPAGTRAFANTPFQLVLPSEHLLGDWFTLRTKLEDRGITPTLTFVTDALGNPTGGLRQDFRAANNLGLDLRFDLEKLLGVHGGSFELSMSQRFGSSLSAEDIGNVFTVQQVFGGETFRVVDVAYQQKLLDDRVELRVGRIAAGDDFLVSPYNYVFVQNGFDGTPVSIFLNAPGMTAYPNATWGALVKGRPTRRIYVMGGLYNGDASIRANNHHGLDWSMHGPAFAIGEVGYQRNGLPGDPGLLGNYKAGLWYDDSRYLDFNTVARGGSPHVGRGNWGLYGLFDQVLARFGEHGSNRGFGVTGSALISPDHSVSQMPFFATAGFVVRGLFPSRPADVGGFGVVSGYFSQDLQESQRRAQVGVQRHETALELTYRFRLLGNALFLEPDLQYINRPGGTGRIPDAFAAGVQAGINF